MTASDMSANADLQSILATLAQYAPPPTNPTDTAEPAITSPSGYPPQQLHAADEYSYSNTPAEPAQLKTQDPRLRPQNQSATASPRPMIDPAKITNWQDGLRCVTKIAAANVQFVATIKKMMKDQRANEMRWYTERQNLKQTQANRSNSAAKALSILNSLNPSSHSEQPKSETREVDKGTELAEFDRKTYSAQVSMEAAMTSELKSLGVPFFGTDEKLIVPEGSSIEALPEGQPKWSPLVTENQLIELRRKMIVHLEDLYRD